MVSVISKFVHQNLRIAHLLSMKMAKTALVLWGVMVTLLSLIPGKTLPDFWWSSLYGIDKIAHWGFYAVWSVLWTFVIAGTSDGQKKPVYVVILLILYSLLLEFLQSVLFWGRYFEWFDLLANTLGALSGFVAMDFLMKKKRLWNWHSQAAR